MKLKNLGGQRFGRLLVESFSSFDYRGYAHWSCVCDCGNKKVINGANLRNGDTTSCGCVHKEQLFERNKTYKGENHPKWKGGITDLNHQVRNTASFSEWRKNVYKANNFTCSECGKRGGNIHAHHKFHLNELLKKFGISSAEDAEKCSELWDVNNGIVLCPNCHKSYHSEYGYYTGVLA